MSELMSSDPSSSSALALTLNMKPSVPAAAIAHTGKESND